MRYAVLFPECEDIHITKGVGMVPYQLHKLYGVDAKIVCYNNGKYQRLEENKGLKIEFLKKITKRSRWDGLLYLLFHSNKIDVLQIFHITSSRNYIWIMVYKLMNPKGKIYLRLDYDSSIKDYKFSGLKGKICKYIFSQCSLISSEMASLASELTRLWNVHITHIPNGTVILNQPMDFNIRGKNICCVGRIGSYQKDTETLLRGFEIFSRNNSEWKLYLIGEISNGWKEEFFVPYIKRYPHLKHRILLLGNINERVKLYHYYDISKICCMTSRFEGYATVFMESLSRGCYLVSTELDSAVDAIDGKYGKVFPIEDYKKLAEELDEVCNSNLISDQLAKEIADYAAKRFDWTKICQEIYGNLITER